MSNTEATTSTDTILTAEELASLIQEDIRLAKKSPIQKMKRFVTNPVVLTVVGYVAVVAATVVVIRKVDDYADSIPAAIE
jgi:hypothetical protein